MGIVESAAETVATIAEPELALPLRILGWCRAGLGGIVGWVAAHPLPALLALSIGLNALLWHVGAVHDRAASKSLAVWQAAFGAERAAVASYQKANGVLYVAIRDQNGTVQHLYITNTKLHQAAQAALAAAGAQGAALRASASALRADAAQRAPVGSCRTPTPVMDERTSL